MSTRDKGSLASQTFFVGGACGKRKRTSGSSCQHSEFSWNLKYSRKSRTLSRAQSCTSAQSCTRAPYPSRSHGEPVSKTSLPLKIPFTANFVLPVSSHILGILPHRMSISILLIYMVLPESQSRFGMLT